MVVRLLWFTHPRVVVRLLVVHAPMVTNVKRTSVVYRLTVHGLVLFYDADFYDTHKVSRDLKIS